MSTKQTRVRPPSPSSRRTSIPADGVSNDNRLPAAVWSHIFQWCGTRQMAGALTRVSRKFFALVRRPESWHAVRLPLCGALAKRFMRSFTGVGRRVVAVNAHTDGACELETLLRYLCFPRTDSIGSPLDVAVAWIPGDARKNTGSGDGDGGGDVAEQDGCSRWTTVDVAVDAATLALVDAHRFDEAERRIQSEIHRRASVAARNSGAPRRTGWAARATALLAPNLALRALTLHIASLTDTWTSEVDAHALTGVFATLFPQLQTLRLTIGTSGYSLDLQRLLNFLAHLRDLQVCVQQHTVPLCTADVTLPLRMVRYREIGCRTTANITHRRFLGFRASSSLTNVLEASEPDYDRGDARWLGDDGGGDAENGIGIPTRASMASAASPRVPATTVPASVDILQPSPLTELYLCHGALLPQIDPIGDGSAYFDCTLESAWLATNLPRLTRVVYRDSHATTSHSTRWCGALARHPSITHLDCDQLPRLPFSAADTLTFLGSALSSKGGDSDESTPDAWRWPTRSNMRRLSVARVATLDFMRSYMHLREIRFRNPEDFDTRGAVVFGHRSSKIHEVLVALAGSTAAVAGRLKYVGLSVHDVAAIAAPFRATLGGVVATATKGDGTLEADSMWPNLEGRHTYRERQQLLREGARDVECNVLSTGGGDGGVASGDGENSTDQLPTRSSTMHVFAWIRGELVPVLSYSQDARLLRQNVVLVSHTQSHDTNLHVSRPHRALPGQPPQVAYRVGVSVRDPSLARLLGGGCTVEFATGASRGLPPSGLSTNESVEVEFDASAPRLTATCRATGRECYCRASPRVWQCEDHVRVPELAVSSSTSASDVAPSSSSLSSSSSPSSSEPQPPAVSSASPRASLSGAVFSTPLSLGSPPRMWSVFVDDIFRYTVGGVVAPPTAPSPPPPPTT